MYALNCFVLDGKEHLIETVLYNLGVTYGINVDYKKWLIIQDPSIGK